MAEKLLDKINYPFDLRKLKKSQLEQVSNELRNELIDVVSETGGHLGAGLGVVELTVALHYVFNTPNDKLVWDVGHQCYPHKIITGRKERIKTLRKGGGLSGKSIFNRTLEMVKIFSVFGVPIIATGGIDNFDQIRILKKEGAILFGMATSLILNPYCIPKINSALKNV